jgi:ceramide glucosyltransferase
MLLPLMAIAFALLTVCSLGYCVIALWSARNFRRGGRTRVGGFAPPVTILKPLKGTDPAAYENLRSHCVQEYPEYELIFGVNDDSDPAAELVRRLMAEFPQRPMRLVVCANVLGANRKVSNLVQMLEHARHRHLVINDSDISVPPDYLRRILAPFESPRTGMVTCPYRGVAGATLGSKLESLGISTEFIPGVLTARKLEGGVHFALGSTLAMTREALEKIGGMETLVDYLADDFELGARIAAAGYDVVLSDCVVDNHLPDYRFGDFVSHQLRWGRSTRHSRPWGYAGLIFTYPLPWAVLTAAFGFREWWTWALLGVTLALRYALALLVGEGMLRDAQVRKYWWLVPVRDFVAVALWIGGFTGRRVNWRGEWFVLEKGKLRPA